MPSLRAGVLNAGQRKILHQRAFAPEEISRSIAKEIGTLLYVRFPRSEYSIVLQDFTRSYRFHVCSLLFPGWSRSINVL